MNKLVLFSVICLMIGSGFAYKNKHVFEKTIKPKQVTDRTFNALVDYFRPQDDSEYEFDFQINLANYEYGGPLFFYINDAGVYTSDWIEGGLMYDISAEVGGMLVTANHRYYGDNIPVDGATWDDLTYLTIEQAIADIAFLINEIQEDLLLPFDRCVVWGTGYGAVLAVWARQKYPHLIDGAWSSSAVFDRIPFTPTFYEYLEEIIELHGGEDCVNQVEGAFDFMNEIIDAADDDDLAELQDDLNLCDPVNTTSIGEVGGFFEVMVNFVAGYIADNDYFGVLAFCDAMDVLEDPFEAWVRWLSYTFNLDIGPCLNLDYDDRVYWTSYTGLDVPDEFRGWRQSLYLICTQLGLLRITDEDSIFGDKITEEFHRTVCEDAFGDDIDMDQLDDNIDRLIIMHGGTDPSIESVVFTNGMLDPFFPLGITENMEEDSISINIPLVGRSADLTSVSLADSFPLYNAKQTIRERVIDWVTRPDYVDDDDSETSEEDSSIGTSEETSEGTSEETSEELIPGRAFDKVLKRGLKPVAGESVFKN